MSSIPFLSGAMRFFYFIFMCMLAFTGSLRAAFPQHVRPVKLAYDQKEAVVVFEADSAIKRAKPLCECTKVQIDGRRLIAKVDTSGFAQNVEKQIEATTEDGVTTKLTMSFVVPQAITLSARTLIWKKGGEASRKVLKISIPKGSPVHRVTEASLSGDDFDYTPHVVKEGEEYSVEIVPRKTDKKILNRLIIKTDSDDKRYAGFIVYLSVQP